MKSKAIYWYLDCGDKQTFSSLAALRFHYSNLSHSEKRSVLGFPVMVIRLDHPCETYGYMDFRGNYPRPSKAWIRREPPENW